MLTVMNTQRILIKKEIQVAIFLDIMVTESSIIDAFITQSSVNYLYFFISKFDQLGTSTKSGIMGSSLCMGKKLSVVLLLEKPLNPFLDW